MMTEDECIDFAAEISERMTEIDDPELAFSVMVSVTCHYFLTRFSSEKDARGEYQKLLKVTSSVIESPSARSFSSWVTGTPH